MKSTTISIALAMFSVPMLAGCVSDAASFQIDGKEHSLSLVREQKWLWEPKVELFVVATRMPDCQRRHRLKSAAVSASSVEVYSPDASTFFLRQGGRLYSVETRTCETFRELTEPPATGLGQKMGIFKESAGQYIFAAEPVSAGS